MTTIIQTERSNQAISTFRSSDEKSDPCQLPKTLSKEPATFLQKLRLAGWVNKDGLILPTADLPTLPLNYGIDAPLKELFEKKNTLKVQITDAIKSKIKRSDPENGETLIRNVNGKELEFTYLDLLKEIYNSYLFKSITLRGGYLRYLLSPWMAKSVEKLGGDFPLLTKPFDIDILIDGEKLSENELMQTDQPILRYFAKKLAPQENDWRHYQGLAAFLFFDKRAEVNNPQAGNCFKIFSIKGEELPTLEIVIAKKLARENLCTLDEFQYSLNQLIEKKEPNNKLIVKNSRGAWQVLIDIALYFLRYQNSSSVDLYGAIRHHSHLALGGIPVNEEPKIHGLEKEVLKNISKCIENHDLKTDAAITAMFLSIATAGSPSSIHTILAQAPQGDHLFSKIISIILKEQLPLKTVIAALHVLACFSNTEAPITILDGKYIRLTDKGGHWLLPLNLKKVIDWSGTKEPLLIHALDKLKDLFPTSPRLNLSIKELDWDLYKNSNHVLLRRLHLAVNSNVDTFLEFLRTFKKKEIPFIQESCKLPCLINNKEKFFEEINNHPFPEAIIFALCSQGVSAVPLAWKELGLLNKNRFYDLCHQLITRFLKEDLAVGIRLLHKLSENAEKIPESIFSHYCQALRYLKETNKIAEIPLLASIAKKIRKAKAKKNIQIDPRTICWCLGHMTPQDAAEVLLFHGQNQQSSVKKLIDQYHRVISLLDPQTDANLMHHLIVIFHKYAHIEEQYLKILVSCCLYCPKGQEQITQMILNNPIQCETKSQFILQLDIPKTIKAFQSPYFNYLPSNEKKELLKTIFTKASREEAFRAFEKIDFNEQKIFIQKILNHYSEEETLKESHLKAALSTFHDLDDRGLLLTARSCEKEKREPHLVEHLLERQFYSAALRLANTKEEVKKIVNQAFDCPDLAENIHQALQYYQAVGELEDEKAYAIVNHLIKKNSIKNAVYWFRYFPLKDEYLSMLLKRNLYTEICDLLIENPPEFPDYAKKIIENHSSKTVIALAIHYKFYDQVESLTEAAINNNEKISPSKIIEIYQLLYESGLVFTRLTTLRAVIEASSVIHHSLILSLIDPVIKTANPQLMGRYYDVIIEKFHQINERQTIIKHILKLLSYLKHASYYENFIKRIIEIKPQHQSEQLCYFAINCFGNELNSDRYNKLKISWAKSLLPYVIKNLNPSTVEYILQLYISHTDEMLNGLEGDYFNYFYDLLFFKLTVNSNIEGFKNRCDEFFKNAIGSQADDFFIEKPQQVIEITLKKSKQKKKISKQPVSTVVCSQEIHRRRIKIWKGISLFVHYCSLYNNQDFNIKRDCAAYCLEILKHLMREFAVDYNDELISLVKTFILMKLNSESLPAFMAVEPLLKECLAFAKNRLQWENHLKTQLQLELYLYSETMPIDFNKIKDDYTYELAQELLMSQCPHKIAKATSIYFRVYTMIPDEKRYQFNFLFFSAFLVAFQGLQYYHTSLATNDKKVYIINVIEHFGQAILSCIDDGCHKHRINEDVVFMKKYISIISKKITASNYPVQFLKIGIEFLISLEKKGFFYQNYSIYFEFLQQLLNAINEKDISFDTRERFSYETITQAFMLEAFDRDESVVELDCAMQMLKNWVIISLKMHHDIMHHDIATFLNKIVDRGWFEKTANTRAVRDQLLSAFTLYPKEIKGYKEDQTSAVMVTLTAKMFFKRFMSEPTEKNSTECFQFMEYLLLAVKGLHDKTLSLDTNHKSQLYHLEDSETEFYKKFSIALLLPKERKPFLEYITTIFNHVLIAESAMIDTSTIKNLLALIFSGTIANPFFKNYNHLKTAFDNNSEDNLQKLLIESFEISQKVRASAWNQWLQIYLANDINPVLIIAELKRAQDLGWYNRFPDLKEQLREKIKAKMKANIKPIE